MSTRRTVLVIHGVGRRDESRFHADVDRLASSIGTDAVFVPVYWGKFALPDERVDSVLPYARWAERDDTATDSRRRLIARIYSLVRSQYLRASAQFTGDLIYYHRHREQLWGHTWETLMSASDGAGLADNPVTVIAHSLGSSVAFEMAVAAHPRLHIDHLFTCATQIPFFHVKGCSPTEIDPQSTGEPARLPPTIRAWTNFYVPLDPWAYLSAPVFTLADGSAPTDIEVRSGGRDDRLLTHGASHYWQHPTVLDTIRSRMDSASP